MGFMFLQVEKNFQETATSFLPSPTREFQEGDTHVFIYTVKNSDETYFSHPELYKILCEARKSYWRYGDVPLIDKYDAKSSIYLTRVIYPSIQGGAHCFLEEWTSMRFIPASGVPFSTEDLESCIYQGQTLSTHLKKTLFQNHDSAWERLITISRICRIRPHIFTKNFRFDHQALPQKNKFTAKSFVAMVQLFLDQSVEKGKNYEWFTALAKEELFTKVLHLNLEEKNFRFPFFQAAKVLGIPPARTIRINRSVLSYRYPGYFLHVEELLLLFEKLIDLKRIKDSFLCHLLGITEPFSDFRKKYKELPTMDLVKILQGISSLLLTEGWIENSSLHASQLRSLCDLCVSDAIQLYLSPTFLWQHSPYEW